MNISPVTVVPQLVDHMHDETVAASDAISGDSDVALRPDGGDSPRDANTGSSLADRVPHPAFELELSQKYTMFLPV